MRWPNGRSGRFPVSLFTCHLNGAGEATREQLFAQQRDEKAQLGFLRKAISIARLFDVHAVPICRPSGIHPEHAI